MIKFHKIIMIPVVSLLISIYLTGCSNTDSPMNLPEVSEMSTQEQTEDKEDETALEEEKAKAEAEAAAKAEEEAEKNAKEAEEKAAREAKALLEEGLNYWYGINGYSYDMEKAVEAFQKSADGGNSDALYWLGHMALYRIDADRWETAIDYYNMAVDAGSAKGLNGLGTLYYAGSGVEQDYDKAIELFTRAIDGGCYSAYVNLAELYANGKGVVQDGKKALELCEKALESNDWVAVNAARVRLGELYFYGTTDITVDMDKAKEYFLAAADDEYAEGYREMAAFYDDTLGAANTDYNEAFKYYSLAAEHGMTFNLGVCYMNGKGADVDYVYAIQKFRQQENGGREASGCLAAIAVCYLNGFGVDVDKDLAREYAEKAIMADTGNSETSPGYGTNLAQRVLDAIK